MNKITKTSMSLFFLTIIVKLFGFLREILIGYFGGTSAITDAYNITNTIPNFFLVVITQVITIAFIPIFISIKEKQGAEESNRFVSKCLFIISIITLVFSLLIFFFPKLLITIFASGISNDTKSISEYMLKICCWTTILQGIVIVFTAFLNGEKRFIIPVILGVFLDFFTILFFFIYSKTNQAFWIALIQLSTSITQAIILTVCVHKRGFKFKFNKKLIDSNIKKLLKISIPALISVGVYEINVLVDKNFASYYNTGAISSLSYAQTINNIFYTLIVNSIILVAYTNFNLFIVSGQNSEAKALLINSIKTILLITLPITILVIFYAKEIIIVVFMRGQFDINSVNLTYKNLIYYVIGLPFLCLSYLVTRYLYSNDDQYKAIIFSTVGLIINILLNFIIFKFTQLGVAGIAAATSAAAIVQAILLLIYSQRKYKIFNDVNYNDIATPVNTSLLLIPLIFSAKRIFNSINSLYLKIFCEFILIFCFYLIVLFLFEPKYAKEFKKLVLRNRDKK